MINRVMAKKTPLCANCGVALTGQTFGGWRWTGIIISRNLFV